MIVADVPASADVVLQVNSSDIPIDHVVTGLGTAADTTRIGVPAYITDYP